MERKLATVLFVDLVDSTGLVTGSDPEVVRRRVQTFFDRVSHCVTTHGGIVEKFAGDAVMAAFGIPQAHEDDAERAIRAGLAILDAVDELELQARIGVESGEVVADNADSTFATGEAVTLAARLEAAAEPGQILLGPGAHRLTLGRIEVEDVGPVELKGLAEPVWAWRALATSTNGGTRPRSLEAPLVGREAELELLQNTFERVAAGQPCAPVHDLRRAGCRQEPARAGVPRVAGRGDRAPRPQPALRRRGDLLAARRDGQVRSRDRRRRPARPRDRQASRLLRGRGRRRPARARFRRARGGAGGEQPAGDCLGRARVGAADGPGAAARARLRGHPLGRGAAARADRAPDDLGSRSAAARGHRGTPGAARHQPGLGRWPGSRDRDRAGAARPERERGAGGRARR